MLVTNGEKKENFLKWNRFFFCTLSTKKKPLQTNARLSVYKVCFVIVSTSKISSTSRSRCIADCCKKACAFYIIVYHRRPHYVVVIVSMNEKWYIKRSSSSYAAETKTYICSQSDFHVENMRVREIFHRLRTFAHFSISHQCNIAFFVLLFFSSFALKIHNAKENCGKCYVRWESSCSDAHPHACIRLTALIHTSIFHILSSVFCIRCAPKCDGCWRCDYGWWYCGRGKHLLCWWSLHFDDKDVYVCDVHGIYIYIYMCTVYSLCIKDTTLRFLLFSSGFPQFLVGWWWWFHIRWYKFGAG